MSRKSRSRRSPAELAPLEIRVMEVLWNAKEATADDVRRALAPRDRLTDSTVRTILRRLEAKRHVAHEREGKRFVFRAIVPRPHAAAAAARRIIETICGGTASALIVGLLESELLTREELDAVRRRLDREKER